jgi:hypothetical protein
MGVAAQPCDRSVRAADIGDVTGVTIAHDGAHSASSWLLESVALTRCNTIRRNAARRRFLRRPHLPVQRVHTAVRPRCSPALGRCCERTLAASWRLVWRLTDRKLSIDRWVPYCRQSDGFCWTMPCNEATPQSRFPFCPQSAAAVRCTLYCRAMQCPQCHRPFAPVNALPQISRRIAHPSPHSFAPQHGMPVAVAGWSVALEVEDRQSAQPNAHCGGAATDAHAHDKAQ